MFRNVVVPVDLSERTRAAVEMAAQIVSKDGRVHLLHVIETMAGVDFEEEKPFYDRLQKAASKHLESLGAILEEKGAQWNAEVAYGARARTILDEASKLEADLIVIQSHRVDETRASQGFGTLSYEVGVFAPCPVLLVK